jgi:sulfatase modifying factor 1
MRRIPGGVFWMGSDQHYPEEAPCRQIAVDGFWIDETPVTNRDFQLFVAATGYVTLAELAPDPAQSPVVHVAYADADAYARWIGKELPTEAEWEVAARGGLDRAPYAWGTDLAPAGAMMANYWQGAFPHENLSLDGYERTSPVRTFPPNGYGLYDMIGNVWEWTSDWYADGRELVGQRTCCIPRNPRGGSELASRNLQDPGAAFGRKVLKGGSHLCAANYCQRYRPAARYAQTVDTSTSHIGFRCVLRK